MGDRISFKFAKKAEWDKTGKKDDTSVVFFSHWSGRGMLGVVEDYIQQLQGILAQRNAEAPNYHAPIDRKEPDTVMVDFIMWLGRQQDMDKQAGHIEGDFYLGKDESDGDDSDNGHWVFDLDTMRWRY